MTIDGLPGEQTERILAGETALKVWREHLRVSREALALGAGLAMERLAALEAGTAPLDPPILLRLAAALGVAPAWIEREAHES